MKSINIDGVPFYYEEEILKYEHLHAISVVDAELILTTIDRLFKQKGLFFSLAFGTLLGAIREHSIIEGDEDVDVFVSDEKKLVSILPFLYNNGVKLIRAQKGHFYSFRVNADCFIDVYILRPLKWSIWSIYCYSLSNRAMPKKYFIEYKEIDFLGGKYYCPQDAESYLAFLYGKSWRTPVRGHKFYQEVKSRWYWRTYIKEPLYNAYMNCRIFAGKIKWFILGKFGINRKIVK